MKILRRILLGLVLLILVVVVGLGATAAWIYHHPQQAWDYVHRHYIPADITVTWASIHYDLHHSDWRHWEFSWQAKSLELNKTENPKLVVPTDDVDLRVGLLISWKPIATFHEVTLTSSKQIEVEVSPSKNPAPPSSPFETARSVVRKFDLLNKYMLFENMHLAAEKLRIRAGGHDYNLNVGLKKAADSNETIEFQAVTLSAISALKQIEIVGSISPHKLNSDQPFLTSTIWLRAKDWSIGLEPRLTEKSSQRLELASTVNFVFKHRKPKEEGELTASLTQNELQVEAKLAALDLPGPMANVENVQASASVPLDPKTTWAASPGKLQLKAPLKLLFIDKNMRKPFEEACKCKVPEAVLATLEAEFWARNYFAIESSERKPLADARVQIESVHNKLFDLNLAGRLKIDRKDAEYIYEPTLNSSAIVRSAQGLIQFLDSKNVLIPAPFDVLDGEIELDARGPFNYSTQPTSTFSTPIDLRVDLRSKRQTVKMTATTTVTADQKFTEASVDIKAKIADLQVELPPLDPISHIPRMTQDSRIKEKPEPTKKQKAAKTKVTFKVQVETATPGAVRLLSAMAKPDVPITLNIGQALPPHSQGFVKVEPFAITYMRRTVQVEYVTVDLKPVTKGVYPLKGRFRVDQTNYKVFIDVGGTTAAPQYVLTSDPFLSQDDVISVLLFDQTTTELGTADAESKGNFQAAMADRAIGLFGLWLFASTPIRSFNYNPVTKIYSASVQLGGGVTAAVGSDFDSSAQLFELRKRLSRHWVVSASYAPGEDGNQVGQLVLQWEKRF